MKKLATFWGVLLISLGCHSPLGRITAYLRYLSDLVCALFYVNLATKFFFRSGVTPPPEGVTRGGPSLLSAPPPIDATE